MSHDAPPPRRRATTGDVVPPGFVLPEIELRGFE
jgi:hypothetical protein